MTTLNFDISDLTEDVISQLEEGIVFDSLSSVNAIWRMPKADTEDKVRDFAARQSTRLFSSTENLRLPVSALRDISRLYTIFHR